MEQGSVATMIKEISARNIQDINKPNQPFPVIGRLCPVFADGEWTFTEILYDTPYEKRYPNDDEDYDAYIDNPMKTVFFYYADDACVGQVRIRKNWNRYAFVEDIAVAQGYRGKGFGAMLIEKAILWAKEKELCGLMLETQDVNLAACRFYHKLGFRIGAVDTMLYANFDSGDEKAIFWYLKF